MAPRSQAGRSPPAIAYSIVKLVLLLSAQLPLFHARPLSFHAFEEDEGKEPEDPTLWIYLSVALVLVLLGGAFAGLTIALMGQVRLFIIVVRFATDEVRHLG